MGNGGIGGFVDNDRGTGRERVCILVLEVGDVVRREGVKVVWQVGGLG